MHTQARKRLLSQLGRAPLDALAPKIRHAIVLSRYGGAVTRTTPWRKRLVAVYLSADALYSIQTLHLDDLWVVVCILLAYLVRWPCLVSRLWSQANGEDEGRRGFDDGDDEYSVSTRLRYVEADPFS